MPFLTQGKTNLQYILVVVVLAVIVGGGILGYLWTVKQEVPPEIIPTLARCPLWYKSIEKAFEEANFCNQDTDCKATSLGGPYIEFGCFKLVNITTDEDELLGKVAAYDKVCAPAIDKCAPAPEAVCVSNKCVFAEKVPADETANWKTYTNKDLKISFKYPNNFYQGDAFGEMYYYQLRFSTCEFEKENGAEVEQGPECPSFSLAMGLGNTTKQYDFVNKIEVGGISVDKRSSSSSGTLTYRKFAGLNTSAGKWLRYEIEAGGKFVPKHSYGIILRKENNTYAFTVSSESKNIVDSNKKVLEQIVSSFKFLD